MKILRVVVVVIILEVERSCINDKRFFFILSLFYYIMEREDRCGSIHKDSNTMESLITLKRMYH